MADRDDPKSSVGPSSEAKPAPPAAAGDDPLAQLARMMSDRSVFDPAPATPRKTVPIPEAVSPTAALANDLEAKLRGDLETLLSTFYSHPAPTPSASSEEPETATPKAAAAAPSAQPQPDAPPAPAPVAPPEQPVTATPKAAAAPPAKPQPAAPPPVAPPEEPVTPAPKPAAAAPPAKPQPAASAAVAAVAQALAAALVALDEKHAPWRERPPIAVPSRSEKQASTALLTPAWRRTTEASQADDPQFVRPLANPPGQAAKARPDLTKASPLRLTTAAPPAGTGTAIAGHDREHRAVKSPAVAREPSRFASTAEARK